uniref:MAM domain-containing protein n=1 Tax=Rhabditophanes sp. KR3021 TaxID=114890 RepID=A0AC35TZ40_9BILA
MIANYFINVLLLLMVATQSVSGCMAGYEAERGKIKQYLGLEWVEKGLEKMDSKDLKAIRHSQDLDCDFQDVSTCNWNNIQPNQNEDTMNFFLFSKTDNAEFPYVRVAPGPSRLHQGDNLIFVGDKKTEEQTAILRSSLIPCQENEGKLSLHYWTYNGARLEVIMYEKGKDGNLKQIHEKLYLDCGTVTLNTDCFAKIPARETPFYLAFRAYDIRNKEGSFVMLDNIKYEADLCNVGLDLGDDFIGNNLITGSNGDFIKRSFDLNCNEWDKQCRWRNSVTGQGQWKYATSKVVADSFYNVTSTFIKPIDKFIYLLIEQYTKGPYVTLISDPIPCQTAEVSILKFRTWASKGVEVSVCTFSLLYEKLECHPIILTQSPALINYYFAPQKNFMYGIHIDKISEEKDNFIAIDDVVYSASLCDDPKNAYDYGNDFYVTNLLATVINRPLHSASDLGCSFAKRGLNCAWGNQEDPSNLPWSIGLGTINMHKFGGLTGTLSLPDGEFVIANFTKPSTAILISETIRCAHHDYLSLSLRYWKSGEAELNVCMIDAYTMVIIDCQPVTLSQPGPVVVDIPKMTTPFKLSLQAQSSGLGTVSVDDIIVNGDICSSSDNKKLNSKHHSVAYGSVTHQLSKQVIEIPDPNVCRLLTCDFDNNHMCLYSSERIPGSNSEFSVINKGIWAVLSGNRSIAMIGSPTFALNTPAKFNFQYRILEGDVDVFVCEDSVKRTFDSCTKIRSAGVGDDTSIVKEKSGNDKSGWMYQSVDILPSHIKLYIVVKIPSSAKIKRARISVDNFILKDMENNSVC